MNAMKRCCLCMEFKDRSQYAKDRSTSDGLEARCKQCNSIRNANKRAEAQAFLKSHYPDKCPICNESKIHYEFAHYSRDNKYRSSNNRTKCITVMCSIKQIKNELTKGRFICTWCHFWETRAENQQIVRENEIAKKDNRRYWYNKKYRNRRSDFIKEQKLLRKECTICQLKVTYESCGYFEFDHIDPTQKVDTINILHSCGKSINFLLEEMSKCRLLCRECHRSVTNEQIAEKKRKRNDDNPINIKCQRISNDILSS